MALRNSNRKAYEVQNTCTLAPVTPAEMRTLLEESQVALVSGMSTGQLLILLPNLLPLLCCLTLFPCL